MKPGKGRGTKESTTDTSGGKGGFFNVSGSNQQRNQKHFSSDNGNTTDAETPEQWEARLQQKRAGRKDDMNSNRSGCCLPTKPNDLYWTSHGCTPR